MTQKLTRQFARGVALTRATLVRLDRRTIVGGTWQLPCCCESPVEPAADDATDAVALAKNLADMANTH